MYNKTAGKLLLGVLGLWQYNHFVSLGFKRIHIVLLGFLKGFEMYLLGSGGRE